MYKNYLFSLASFFLFVPLFSMNGQKVHKKNKNTIEVAMNVACLLYLDEEVRNELGLKNFNSQSNVYARIEVIIQSPHNNNFSVPTFLPYDLLQDKKEGSEITVCVPCNNHSKIVVYHCSGKEFKNKLDVLYEHFKRVYRLSIKDCKDSSQS